MEAAAEAVAVVIIWFIGCGGPIKGRRDCWFLFSYIYKVRKAATNKRVKKGLTL